MVQCPPGTEGGVTTRAALDTVIDITRAATLPTDPTELAALAVRATATATAANGWEALIETMARHDAALRGMRPERPDRRE